ncbi:MAG: glutathione S-transferase family protein [Alphaproteobacteria bacterium]|nr:glutathione S-transferase family protein [Alphaproteobacteria bacterium]
MAEARYRVTYWPTAFRGCFVSYLLAYRDVAFVEEEDPEKIAYRMALPTEDQPVPWIGPPLLEDLKTGRALSQVPAIALYLSRALDLQPDDPYHLARCLKIQMDCNDVLMEICRYNGTMMWEREAWSFFRSERLPRWMDVFEQELDQGTIGKPRMNFADIAVFALFGNMVRCLPDLASDLARQAPRLCAQCLEIGSAPSVAAYVAEQEKKFGLSYCGGQIEQSIRDQLRLDAKASS